MKKELERSGVGGSEPRRDLKCSNQMFRRSSVVPPGILEKGTEFEDVISLMIISRGYGGGAPDWISPEGLSVSGYTDW